MGGLRGKISRPVPDGTRLEAVRDNHVIYMGEQLFHPSPVVFDALEQLAKELHPEAF